MIGIWKKELRSLMGSVVGFLYAAAALFLFGVYFYVINLYQGMAHVSYAYASCVYLFIVTIPILTMRSFAQEFRDKTDQLLFTAPISLWKIVAGKYLAMITLFMIPVLIAALYPLLLLSYGEVDLTEAYTTLLGYTLYGVAAIAIGMLMSSMTNSTVVAAVLTAVILFLTYTMEAIGELLGVSAIQKFLSAFHMQGRFLTMEAGVISIRSILYFLSIAAGGFVLTILRLRQLRGGFGGNGRRRIRRGAALILTVIAVVLVNVTAALLPDSLMEHDLTMREYQQVTPATEAFLERLDREVTVYVYSRENVADVNIVKTLKNYEKCDKVHVEYVDPDLSPRFTTKYAVNGLEQNSLIVVSDTRFRTISYNGLYTYSDDSMEEYGLSPDGFDLEGQLTSAIDYVTTKNIPQIYQLTGHGELTLSGDFATAVSRENVDLTDLQLVTTGTIPADAQCLLLLAPAEDYSEKEIELLREYLNAGGNMYVLLQWRKEPQTRLHGLLAEYGIQVENGIVSETDTEVYFQEPYYLIPTIQKTAVTEELEDFLALSAMTVGIKTDNPEIQAIIKTSDQAFLKKDPQNAESREWEAGDEKGEFILGLYLERTIDVSPDKEDPTGAKVTRQSKLVVFGSPYMTQDAIDDYISGMNLRLFTVILSKMVRHPGTVSIPAKTYSQQYVAVSMSDATFFGVILSAVLPGLTLVSGVIIWILRRRR